VLFLPGMMGSRLFEVSFACGIFNNEKERWVSRTDCDHARLALDENGKSVHPLYTKEGEEGVIDDAYSFNMYQSFMNDLARWKNDDHLIADYALVSYDWRLSLEDILQNGATSSDGTLTYGTNQRFFHAYIYNKLAEMAHSSRTGKVTIVAHSNGGLVAKALLQKLKETHDPLYDKIDKLILVAVPQSGTPEAVSNLLHGDQIGPWGFVMGRERLRDLTQNMPGAYHLLPSDAYFSGDGARVDTPVISFADGTSTQPFISAYGHSIVNSTDLSRFLTGVEGRAVPSYADLDNPARLSPALLASAAGVHRELDDNWQFASSTMVYQIAGWGEDTLGNINYRSVRHCERVEKIVIAGHTSYYCASWGSRLTFDPNEVIDGDGTVVVSSALAMSTSSPNVQRYWVDLDVYNNDHEIVTVFGFLSFVHRNILEVSELRDFLKNTLIGASTSMTYISSEIPQFTGNTSRLLFTLHSPLTLEFTDDLGRHVGPSTSTPEQIDTTIPGARYNRYGDVQLLSIPKTATGTLILHGISPGSFTLDIKEQNGNTILATTSFEGIPSATSTVVTMAINPDFSPVSDGTLRVDVDGDGGVDETFQSRSGEIILSDITPPEAKFIFGTSTARLLTRGIDMSSTTVYTDSTSTTIIDNAGNITNIQFSSFQEENRRIKVKIDSISYNGVITLVNAALTYKWKTNKKGEYTMFAAYVKNASSTIEVHYRPKKNQTIIMQKPQELDDTDDDHDDGRRPVKVEVSGMVVPFLVTDQGKISINY
jgi:pimeloyl-ACP methyl ester carboxylesterase